MSDEILAVLKEIRDELKQLNERAQRSEDDNKKRTKAADAQLKSIMNIVPESLRNMQTNRRG